MVRRHRVDWKGRNEGQQKHIARYAIRQYYVKAIQKL